MSRKDLPDPKSAVFAERVREVLQTYLGIRGDKLDKGLTIREAIARGLLDGNGNFNGSNLPGPSGPTGPSGPPGPPGDSEIPDLTPPPTPTGLAVDSGISTVFIAWDVAGYLMGHGPGQTNIYGAKWPFDDPTAPTFAEAVMLGVAPHALTLYAHPTDPNTRWCIWIKFQTADGVESVVPAGGTNGAQTTTGQDVTLLLEALTGQITESQLFNDLAERIDGIEENTAAIAVESSIRSSQTGYLGAQYTVRLDVGGRVAGYGIAGTSAPGAGTTFDFGIRTDKFYIAPPLGSALPNIIPFIVQASPTTINGVAVPAGVYINDAYIRNGTITNAKIGNAVIDDAKIANLSAAKLSVGTGIIGGNLRSSNYSAGTAGWLLQPNGTAEFGFASIRGTLIANQIGANYITTNMLQADSVTATKINVTQLSAITADVGLLRTASSGGRQEIEGNRIRIFDASNVLRVKIGYLL